MKKYYLHDGTNNIGLFDFEELNQKSRNKSISMSQILYRNYNLEEALLIVREMNDMLNSKLRTQRLAISFKMALSSTT